MARLSIGVSADAKEASDAFKSLAEDIKGVGTASVEVTDAVTRAGAAFEKLERAKDSPGAITAAMARARQSVTELNAALARTPPASAEYQRISDALTLAGNAMQTAAARAAQLKTAQDQAAASVARFRKESDGLGAAAERLGDSIRKQTEGFNKMRGATMEVWAAFGIGKQVGEALSAVIEKQSARMAAHDQKMNEAAVNTIKFESAMRLARQGLIDVGGTQEQFLARYDAYVESLRQGRKAVDEEAEALKRRKAAFDEMMAGLPDLQQKHTFTLMSPEDAAKQMDSVKALAEGLNNAFEKAFQAGGEGERDKWVAANEAAVKKVIEAYEKAGLELPTHLKAIAQAHDDSAAQAMEWANKEAAAYDQVAAATERRRAAEDAARNRTSKAPAEFKAIQDEAFGAAVAMGELGTNLDNVAEAVVATGGTMTIGQPYFIQYAQATKEATQALLDFAVASKAVREEQAEAMTVTKGWTDYILTLKDGYESGITSLYNYVTALGSFKTQLQQMFAGAHGDAKDALEGIIALIDKLVQTAGAGTNGQFGTPDFSPLRQLEREFGQ